MNVPIKFQIGKQGVTQGVLDSLLLAFKNHKVIRISVLKASGRDRESIRQLADQIIAGMDKRYAYTYSIIGFTIILRRKLPKHAD